MKYLVIFKRIEIWLLLAVLGFVFYSAFRPVDVPGPEPAEVDDAPVETVSSIVQVDRVDRVDPAAYAEGDVVSPEVGQEAVRVETVSIYGESNPESTDTPETQQGRIVEVTLLARAPEGEEVAVNESTLTAETATGARVPHFFEPFREKQVVHAAENTLVTVRLWLEQPADKLWLEFLGERTEVELMQGAKDR